MDKGGVVLWAIFVLALILSTLFVERIIYLSAQASSYSTKLANKLAKRPLFYELIRLELLAKQRFFKNLSIIKVGIAMLPLLGLLGTVTGMIEVFEVMASFGNSNPRLMASGVSKAIIPTMTGMAMAVFSLLILYVINTLAAKRQRQAITQLKEVYNATL
jgi:biopolymer transport protein ExbB